MAIYSKTPPYMTTRYAGGGKMPSLHYHNSFELYYLEVGNREYFVEDKLFSVAAGDFVLISPGKLHRTGGEYGERVLVGFTEAFLVQVYSPEVVKQLTGCFDRVKITPSPAQQEGCKYLLRRHLASSDETEKAISLGLLLLELSKCDDQEIEDDFISRIVVYINEHYGDLQSIDQIAQHFFISKYYLCRVFKNAMKVTVIEYLNKVRIKNACQMLDFSQREVGEIAKHCGYSSMAYFSNVFKKLTGKSPTAYRKDKNNQ